MVHSVELIYVPQNFEQYRHVVTCSCGWRGRMATEEAAKSQGLSHLAKWGVGPESLTVAVAHEAEVPAEPTEPAEPTVPTEPTEPTAPHPIFGGEGKTT